MLGRLRFFGKKVHSPKGVQTPQRKEVSVQGITGTFTFDEHHNPVKSTAILTYVDGKPELKEMF